MSDYQCFCSEETGLHRHPCSLLKRIEELEAKLALAKTCIEFYANPDTWQTKFSQIEGKKTIVEDITDDGDSPAHIRGNKARACLEKLRGVV